MGMSLSGTLTNPRYPMESEIHMGNDVVLGGQGDGFVSGTPTLKEIHSCGVKGSITGCL